MNRTFSVTFLAFMTFATTSALADTITVSAAISLKDALAAVAEQYKAETGEEVRFILGSSGQLANQIENGAPVDLFISAAEKQVEDLAKAKAVDPSSRKVVAGNALVVVVPPGGKSVRSLKELADAGVKKVAMGDPKSVPAGQYAEQAMKSAGVTDAVEGKLIFGANVRQVLDYVERGEVSAGIVYATDAKVSGEKVRVACVVEASAHEPIVYPAVVVSTSKKRRATEKFLDYLMSEKAQAKLKGFGFTPPPTERAARPVQ